MAAFLTDNDIQILKELIRDVKRLGPHPRVEHGQHSFQAPDLYVARTPSSGISGLDENDLGTAIDDAPGFDDCDIWKIDPDTDLMLQYNEPAFTKTIYNISTSAIEGDTWIVVGRTKQGKWVALFPSEGLIRFELKTELLPTEGATATAHPLNWTGADWEPDQDGALEFEVTSMTGQWWGRAIDSGVTPGARGYVKHFADSDTHEIVQCQTLAESIEFTLNEDMPDAGPFSAGIDVDDFYRGLNPDTYEWPDDFLEVYDPQELFSKAQSGAKGKATLDLESQQYRITECEQMATTLLCQAAETTSGSPFDVSNIEVWNQLGGQDPTAGTALRDPTQTGVVNTFGDDITNTQRLVIDWNKTDDTWEVSEIKRAEGGGLAKHIEFTLAQNLNVYPASTSANVQDWYQGTNPGSPVDVFDEQGRFPLALFGAKGKAVYNNEANEYRIVECQQMATTIRCKVDSGFEVYEDTLTIECTLEDALNPPDSQTPFGTVFDPAVLDVANQTSASGPIGYRLRPNQQFLATWDESQTSSPGTITGGWVIIDSVQGDVAHAVAIADWNDLGGRNADVSCHRSSSEGVVLTENDGTAPIAVTVTCNRKRTKSLDYDPDIYEDDIIEIARSHETNSWFCVSPYLHSKVGEIRWQMFGARIPTGWTRCDDTTVDGFVPPDLRGATMMGLNDADNSPGSNETTLVGFSGNPPVGDRNHGGASNNHSDHPPHDHEPLENDSAYNTLGGVSAQDVDDFHDDDEIDPEGSPPTEVFTTDADSGHTHDVSGLSHDHFWVGYDAGSGELVPSDEDLVVGSDSSDGGRDHDETDNRMPFQVLFPIVRYK